MCMLYLFHGENTYAAKQQIQKLVERYQASTGSDFGLHRFDEESEPAEVIQALTTVPMFSEASLVVVDNPSRSKELREALEGVLDAVPEKTVLIIYDLSIDKRTTWFKALQERATVKEFTYKTLAQKRKWVEREFQNQGGSIDKDAVELLLEYVEDEWQLEQEVHKLATAAETVTEEDIRDLVTPAPQQTIFTLLDALTAGHTQTALSHWGDLQAQKVHELEVLAMLGWQVRILLILAASHGQDDTDLARRHSINPYVIRKSRPVAKRLKPDELQAAYEHIMATDYAMKTSGQEPTILLEQLFMQLGDKLNARTAS